jgi:hypothetical protein
VSDAVKWGSEPELRPVAISYSGGTSSEWMVEAVIRGVIPRPAKCAVFFADTGGEHEWTYRHVAEVQKRCEAAGLPFFRVAKPGLTLAEHILSGGTPCGADGNGRRMDQPPLHIDKGPDVDKGRAPQRCSREFKTAVLRRAQRRWLRDHGYRRPWLVSWIGFAADEPGRVQRAVAKPDVKWAMLDFPAFNLGIARSQQKRDLVEWTGRAPRFSCCVFCPHKSPGRWGITSGADADLAVRVDEAVRDLDEFGLTDGPAYLSDRLVPVSTLIRRPEAFAAEEADPNGCDAGACFV